MKKLQVLVKEVDPKDPDKMQTKYVDVWVNFKHVMSIHRQDEHKSAVELVTGKTIIAKGVDFDSL